MKRRKEAKTENEEEEEQSRISANQPNNIVNERHNERDGIEYNVAVINTAHIYIYRQIHAVDEHEKDRRCAMI